MANTLQHNGFIIDIDKIPPNLRINLPKLLERFDEAIEYLESSATGLLLVQNQKQLGIPIVFDNNDSVPPQYHAEAHWDPRLSYVITNASGQHDDSFEPA